MKMLQSRMIWVLAATLAGGLALAADTKPNLVGEVVEPDGTLVAKATVMVYTAAPKEGASSTCPYCFPDCQKKTQTDADGHFTITALDPSLLFRVLVLAAGHESQFLSKVDPAKGEQNIVLKPQDEVALKSPLRVKGLVMDEHGQPVPGAMINPRGLGHGPSTTWGSTSPEVLSRTVTDQRGQFVFTRYSNDVDTVYATIDGRGLAQQWITLKPGGDFLVRMTAGVALTGRVLRNGQSAADVSIIAATMEREAGKQFNLDAVTSDANGRFTILNVPPNREFRIFSTMKSLQGSGALRPKTLTTGDSGTTNDLGELDVQAAYIISGRVVLSDSQPLPANTHLYLGREDSFDSQQVTLGADGSFEFKGVPPESVSIGVRIKGYRTSTRNPSLDWLNGRILGRVSGDVTGLTILMEPGTWHDLRNESPGGDDEYPAQKPLRSVKL